MGERAHVWLVALRLPLDHTLQHAEVAAALDRELAEEAGEGKAARAGELAEQVQLRRRHPCFLLDQVSRSARERRQQQLRELAPGVKVFTSW